MLLRSLMLGILGTIQFLLVVWITSLLLGVPPLPVIYWLIAGAAGFISWALTSLIVTTFGIHRKDFWRRLFRR